MANPTAGVPITTTPYADSKTKRDLAATAQTYYPGEAIGLDSSGNSTKCDDAAALKFDGFQADSYRITVESGDAAGDKKVNTQRPRYAISSIVQTPAGGDEGKPVFWAFSNQVSLLPGTNANFAGYIHRVVDATLKLVEIEIVDRGGALLVAVPMLYDANGVDRTYWTASRAYRVISIVGRVDVAGTDGSAVTAAVKKAPSATAIASGTALHSSTFNLKGTAATNQILTLSTTTADLDIASGDSIGIDFTGTLTVAVGQITVLLAPVGK